jgi:hypothetical protein
MPISPPLSALTPTGTVATIQQDVLDALQGRTDVSPAQIANAVSKSVFEITESQPFEELRTVGPNFTLTQYLTTYPIDVFLNEGDDYTSNESFAIYIDYPGNTVANSMKYRTPKAMETMIAPATQGVPSYWTRFGPNISVGPTPNQPYTMFMRYQVRHPFSTPASINDPLYITNSWFDIVAYAAAMRICITKRWTDQRKELHDLLYGDPEYISSEGKKGRPGLIAARLFQVERDQRFDTRQLMPVTPRYNQR